MGKASKGIDISLVDGLSLNKSSDFSRNTKLPPSQPIHRANANRPSNVKNNSLPNINSSSSTPKPKPKSARKSKPPRKRQLEPLKPLTPAEHTNVTCRFILKPRSSLTPTTINVDRPIPSNLLWRVISAVQECPICLEDAEVPRMLGCGHIMCLHCLIQHRAHSETPEVCPICSEVVTMSPSKVLPVSFLYSDQNFLPKDGEEVIMTLMSRPAESCKALPVDLCSNKPGFPDPELSFWTRVCEGSLEYAKNELARERTYLIHASKKNQEEFGSDDGYDNAITEIIKQQQHLNETSHPPNQTSQRGEKQRSLSHDEDSTREKPKRSKSSEQQPTGKQQLDELFYFYQTAFESPVVYTLSTLDVSILRSAYGDFQSFPSSLQVKVENIEYSTFDRLRDRHLKHLAHLPEQTQVAFLDCDWTGVLPHAVLEKFKSRLDERKKEKKKKQAQDFVDRRKAEASIERQFKNEIAEAMLPHDIGISDPVGIDTSRLPSLPNHPKPTVEPQGEHKPWVDDTKDYEEIMKKAYTPKRGRKDIIIQF